ncbi:MAG: hypothetical protein DWQ05_03220 [Calditrichaeota bacterium]|nr:MAG: hypothetical protein DWQ05_03220 [Calditrichota bacterium]
MAYKPSQRRSFEAEPTEPNLTPIMNLMVVLIPLLLSSAEYVKLGAIELNLPPVAGPLHTDQSKLTEGSQSLNLTLLITRDAFFVSNSLPENPGKQMAGVEIKREKNAPLRALQNQLYLIKAQTPGYYRDKDSITIQASAGIKYQEIIEVIDAARTIKTGDREMELFPVVRLSAGVI